jgi:hypothetical protein
MAAGRTIGLVGFAVIGVIASAAADPVIPPKPGQKATFSCEGLYGGTYVYETASVEAGMIEYRLIAPNHTHRTLVMPVFALGTSLYRKDYGEGYGRGEMTFGLDAFSELAELKDGTTIEGDVTEKTSGSSDRRWHYRVAIGPSRAVQDPVLGAIEIVPITEHRSSGGLSSDREAHLDPKSSELVYSRYSDSSGKVRTCHITGFAAGK